MQNDIKKIISASIGVKQRLLADERLLKTAEQVVTIAREIIARSGSVLVTRIDQSKAEVLLGAIDGIEHHADARLAMKRRSEQPVSAGHVAVVSAGTSDQPVAEEAARTLEFLGIDVRRYRDLGVSGLHRLLAEKEKIAEASALIVVAGMEGALPSVVGGLVGLPIIAVPTSTGYGLSLQGVTALLAMLNSCAAGVTVVNVDNGFGAGVAAARIARAIGRVRDTGEHVG